MNFPDNIRREAEAQRALRAENRPIPISLQRYARLGGLMVMLVCGAGSVAIAVLGYFFGTLYWVVILFFLSLGAAGFLQVVTGRHWITGTRR